MTDLTHWPSYEPGVPGGLATLDGEGRPAQLPDLEQLAPAARLSQGKQSVVDLIAAQPMAAPPTLTWAGTGGSFAGVMASYTQITDPVLTRWDDERVRWVGGHPLAYPSAGYADNLGAVTVPDAADPRSRFGVLSHAAIATPAPDVSLLMLGNNTQYFRVWINGQPHAANPVQVPYNDGLLRTLKVGGLPAGDNTIMVELDGGLFGGFIVSESQPVAPPPGVATGPSALFGGDSYSIAYSADNSLRAMHAYPFRAARRLGIDRVYVSGFGGSGVLADSSGTGKKYRDRLTADRPYIPDDLSLIVLQGSTNDGNFHGTEPAAIYNETLALLDYCAEQWPNAQIVLTSTLRCADPTANDLIASAQFKAAAALRPDVLYIDQIEEGWFGGTGTVAAPAGDGNADTLIQADASHPTATGEAELGDRLATAISDRMALPARSTTPPRSVTPTVPRCRVRYGGSQTITSGSSTQVLTLNQEQYDVGDMWEGVTNPTRITFPEAGTYSFGAAIEFPAAAGGTRRLLSVRLNGATLIHRVNGAFNGSAPTNLQCQKEREFAAGDYIEFIAYQDSGGDLALSSGNGMHEAWASKIA